MSHLSGTTCWIGILMSFFCVSIRFSPLGVLGVIALIPLSYCVCSCALVWNLWYLRGKPWGVRKVSSFGLLLVLLIPFYHNFQISTPAHQTNKDFTVLSLNVGQFKQGPHAIDSLASLIRKNKPDVVCLQEFGFKLNWQNKDSLISILANKCSMPYYQFSRNRNNIFGMATLARFEIESVDNLFLPVSETNGAAKVGLNINGEVVTVINCHLSSYNFGGESSLSFFEKIERSEKRKRIQSKKILAETKSNQDPLLIVGDMNSTPSTYVYGAISKNLKDSFLEKGNGFGYTFPIGPLGLRIDYQFVSESIIVKDHVILDSGISDHYAILARYSVKRPT